MKISLRPVSLDDGPLLVKWRNTPMVSAHCLNQQKITLESNEEFFHTHIETNDYRQYIVEEISENDLSTPVRPISTVYLKDIDKTNRRCELCIFIADDQKWSSEKQCIAVKLLLKKAFEELRIHKVYSYAFFQFINEASLLKNAGFKTEAILKEEVVNAEGEFDDIVRFVITDSEWMNMENFDKYC